MTLTFTVTKRDAAGQPTELECDRFPGQTFKPAADDQPYEFEWPKAPHCRNCGLILDSDRAFCYRCVPLDYDGHQWLADGIDPAARMNTSTYRWQCSLCEKRLVNVKTIRRDGPPMSGTTCTGVAVPRAS